MMPPKRPREEARVEEDVVVPQPEQQRPQQAEQQGVAAEAAAAAAPVEDVTPPKRVRLNLTESSAEEESKSLGAMVAESSDPGRVVTPALVRQQRRQAAASAAAAEEEDEKSTATTRNATARAGGDDTPGENGSVARRALFSTTASSGAAASAATAAHAAVVTEKPRPAHVTPSRDAAGTVGEPAAKRKLIFGRLVTETVVQENVREVYRIIRKLTGSIGGNGSHGPIYGELTMGSMQKMVNLMKEHTGLCSSSRFIDVGSGIGKPNFHVAQDPGVEFSYGIEIEADRWLLGVTCLKQVLNVAEQQQQQQQSSVGAATTAEAPPSETRLQHRVLFEHGDVTNAKTLDPFTHVYMFSIGFPPQLWITLSEMWNRSTSPYMICFHSPKDVIKNYEFDVELVTQIPTSMHGSKEGHTGYIYRRKTATTVTTEGVVCDPLFAKAQQIVRSGGLPAIKAEVDAKMEEKMNKRARRSSRQPFQSP